MKRSAFLLTPASLLLAACLAGTALAAEQQNAFSEVRLTQESLPHGMTIAREARVPQSQLLGIRVRIGFPLEAIFRQTMIYDNEQARINYMLLPDEKWLDFGYSKLIRMSSDRDLMLSKGKTIVQIAASTVELQDRIARLLEVDPLHYRKIRIHNLPQGWSQTSERYLPGKRLRRLDREPKEQIQSVLVQEFLAAHVKVKVIYYDCETPQAAEKVALLLEDERSRLVRWLIKSAGAIVVVAESQDEEVNQHILTLVNW